MAQQLDPVPFTTPSLLGWCVILFLCIFACFLLVRTMDFFLRGLPYSKENRIYFLRIAPWAIIADAVILITGFQTILIGIGGFYDDFARIVLQKVFEIEGPIDQHLFLVNLICLLAIVSPFILHPKTVYSFLLALRNGLLHKDQREATVETAA